MKEITGDLWDYYGQPNVTILITTNGFIKKNGNAVMGRGCALEATQRIPGLAKKLGGLIRTHGNVPIYLHGDLIATFPVKHVWYEKADLELIKESARWLAGHAQVCNEMTFVLPRPGCGNGQLSWEQVKPLLKDLPDNVLVIDKPQPQVDDGNYFFPVNL